jgi:hypothetical protein
MEQPPPVVNAKAKARTVGCPDQVEEFQGLYGPYHVSEHLLQKIWMRRELDLARLQTVAGEPIRVLRAGRWNRLGGPDFVDADLEVAGDRISGDVEIHFRQEDWFAHRHHRDPAYDRVVLHLVLVPPGPDSKAAITCAGQAIRTASLMDLLWHDLEEYALNEAVAGISNRSEDRALEPLLELSRDDGRSRLIDRAERRWAQKVHFSRVRTRRLGWVEACHATVLEVLGYSRNRSGMLAAAGRYPLKTWIRSGFDPASILESGDISWQLQGVRPANQPGRRLSQYAAICAGKSLWTDRLSAWADRLPARHAHPRSEPVQDLRRSFGLVGLRRRMQDEVLRGSITGPRMNSIAADALLPMLAARGVTDLFGLWFAWPPGDVPTGHRAILRQAGVAGMERAHPYAHGWFQGLLGLLLE